jgi:hypothetical protein
MTTYSKPAAKSKQMWTGATLTAFGASLIPIFQDPEVITVLTQAGSLVLKFIPPQFVPFVVMGGGILSMILRKMSAGKKIEGVVKQK